MSNARNRFLLYSLSMGAFLLPFFLHGQNASAASSTPPMLHPATARTSAAKGSVRDSMVSIKGILMDQEEKQRLSNVRVFFTRREKKLMVGVLANEKGEFSRKIAPGLYDIEAQFTGKSALKLENYRLIAGASYYIRIEMSTGTSRAVIERKK